MNLTLLTAASNATLIGHVHVAKTAGTTINGVLALNFHNVCGHKGYSLTYSAYQRKGAVLKGEGKVMPLFMMQRGFEDCDWLSHEIGWRFWLTLPRPLELHIPCRNITEHLLSVANYRGMKFNCQGDARSEFQRIVGSFMHVGGRFHINLTRTDGITAKCFDPSQYIPYMSTRLAPKRELTTYALRPTNKKRPIMCLPENIVDAALEHPYYKYCNDCERLDAAER